MIETERKYLLINDRMPQTGPPRKIKQGYLLLHKSGHLRVRVIDDVAFICYKAHLAPDQKDEFEYLIPVKDGLSMLKYSQYYLEKDRYVCEIKPGLLAEIDLYGNGLGIVEIETSHYKGDFEVPDFCGEDVTGNEIYTNIALAKLIQ